MWALARHKIAPSSLLFQPTLIPLSMAISLGGASDLKRHFNHFKDICGEGTLSRLFDGTPQQSPDNYQQGTASGLLPIAKPQIYITGDEDLAVPSRFADAFCQRAQAQGDDGLVQSLIVKGVGHHEYNDPRHPIFSLILKQLQQAFK